ncbi:diadenosine tetraphosphatase [Gardnerella sp. DNF01162]|uniref:dihydrofolate reductase n=1 Tax=Gardnerella TaxID=2701 RepID=UPI000C99F50C|nr:MULTISPECIES: dihydrofolate reductase [Gardnerella]PMC44677.1 diadenosine tetraphosphatase [Gardnerella vaginalis]RIY27219.1 diadenosine tetraphosphatase [Bifidobacteriaceae bacterium WP021]MDK7093112.1 dihydrofolate reductase [Gardnerella swidsinskii]PNP90802.1 diadenosine tetraphosphatase [Gardnerella sp. DNF01162]UQA88377.1 dihydrofolate reductase [Gardnerella swidsinskii]
MANSVSHNFPVRLIWGEAFGLDGRPGAMGVNGGMPWRLSPDLRYFKAMTIGCPVIMGRGTWDAMPPKFRPLPGRENIVVTHNPDFVADRARSFTSIDAALDYAREWLENREVLESQESVSQDSPLDGRAIWVIGGAAILREMLANYHADAAYVTQIEAKVAADTFAPNIHALVDAGKWHVAREGEFEEAPLKVGSESNPARYRFMVYEPAQ